MIRKFLFTFGALLVLAAPFLAQSGKEKPSLEQALIAKEKEVWEAFKRKDADALKGLLADNAIEITDIGSVSTKEQQISNLPDLTISEYTMQDAKVTMINKDAAILNYRLLIKGSYKGKDFGPDWSMASAVWANRGGKWQNVLYQETPIKQN